MRRTKEIQSTPKKAVLKFCRQCVIGDANVVKRCGGALVLHTAKECEFYRYRLGEGRPSVQIIRKHCLICQGNSYQAVRDCTSINCPVHFYRLGTNPNRQGIGKKIGVEKGVRLLKTV